MGHEKLIVVMKTKQGRDMSSVGRDKEAGSIAKFAHSIEIFKNVPTLRTFTCFM